MPARLDQHVVGSRKSLQPRIEMRHEGVNRGRAAGSLAWAGIANTFYWIDPKRKICAVIMMQFLPFVDQEAVGLLGDFERAVYAAG